MIEMRQRIVISLTMPWNSFSLRSTSLSTSSSSPSMSVIFSVVLSSTSWSCSSWLWCSGFLLLNNISLLTQWHTLLTAKYYFQLAEKYFTTSVCHKKLIVFLQRKCWCILKQVSQYPYIINSLLWSWSSVMSLLSGHRHYYCYLLKYFSLVASVK